MIPLQVQAHTVQKTSRIGPVCSPDNPCRCPCLRSCGPNVKFTFLVNGILAHASAAPVLLPVGPERPPKARTSLQLHLEFEPIPTTVDAQSGFFGWWSFLLRLQPLLAKFIAIPPFRADPELEVHGKRCVGCVGRGGLFVPSTTRGPQRQVRMRKMAHYGYSAVKVFAEPKGSAPPFK